VKFNINMVVKSEPMNKEKVFGCSGDMEYVAEM
jgi:hypothetical protein